MMMDVVFSHLVSLSSTIMFLAQQKLFTIPFYILCSTHLSILLLIIMSAMVMCCWSTGAVVLVYVVFHRFFLLLTVSVSDWWFINAIIVAQCMHTYMNKKWIILKIFVDFILITDLKSVIHNLAWAYFNQLTGRPFHIWQKWIFPLKLSPFSLFWPRSMKAKVSVLDSDKI